MSTLSSAEKKALKKQQNQLEVKDICVNCEQFIALDQRFCSHCGGKRIYNKLTWHNLLEDFVDRFFNLENSFLKTFVAMFRQPEDVIGGYINGMRKKYLPAFSYFAIAITIAGFFGFVLKNYFLEDVVLSSIQTPMTLNANPEMANFQENINQDMIGSTRDYLSWVTDNQTLIYVMIIPLLAIISRLVFWNYKKYNLVEHLVIYLYAYSHIAMITTTVSLMLIWNSTAYKWWGLITFPIMIFYVGWVLKRLYKMDASSVILKTGLFGVLLGFIIIISFIPILVINVSSIIKGEDVDGVFAKAMKMGFDSEMRKAEQKTKHDSIKKDSLKRLEFELEITPDMIKNRPQ